MSSPHETPGLLRAHGTMFLMTLLVASSFPVAAAIAGDLPPGVLMGMRFVLAALLLAPIVLLEHGPRLPPLRRLFAYALLSLPLSVFFWCMFEAMRFTTAVHAGALSTLVPLMTTVLAFLMNGTRASGRRWTGLWIGTLGALWIVFDGDLQALLALELHRGDGVFLVGCVFLAAYYPLNERLQSGEPPEVLTFWILLFSASALCLASWNLWPRVDWQAVPPRTFWGVAYLAVFTTLVTFFLLQRCVVVLGSTRAAAYGFLTPALVVALTLVLGTERPALAILPGLGLVLVAMVCIQSDAGRAGTP